MRRPVAAVLGVMLALAIPSCRPGAPSGGGSILVVAAENVYGDIAERVGGADVSVTSILSDPQADPHLFEPGTANGAEVAHADVVIENGLGYDAFMQRLLDASPRAGRIVVNVSAVIGITTAGSNPHLWYDIPKVPDIAAAIARALGRVRPAAAPSFTARLAAFDRSMEPLQRALDQLRAAHQGEPVAYTEPVPGYLLQAAGLSVRTPPEFARAIEDGSDPTPQAVAAMNALFTGRQVRVLLFNSQATSPVTDRIRSLASANAVPIVPVTETLPAGRSFVDWQLGQVRALAAALGA